MVIDPNLVRIVFLIIVVGLIFTAFTYLVDFIRPILIAVVLLVIAYFVYRVFVTGTLSF